MAIRRFALIGGALMLVMGILSFVPALQSANAYLPTLKVENSYGLFLGFFPMNIFNKVALLLFGAAGVIVARSENVNASIGYARTVTIVMGVLAVFGFIPMLATLFGYWPLFGGEVVAHGAFAIAGAYYGFALPARLHLRESHA